MDEIIQKAFVESGENFILVLKNGLIENFSDNLYELLDSTEKDLKGANFYELFNNDFSKLDTSGILINKLVFREKEFFVYVKELQNFYLVVVPKAGSAFNFFDFLVNKISVLQTVNKELNLSNSKLLANNKNTVLLNQQLQDKQSYLNSILKTVPASIILISENIILYTNHYTCLMTGFDIEELIGHDIDTLFESGIKNVLFSNTVPGGSKSVTTTWKIKDGAYIDVYLTATNLDSEVAKNAFTISAVDISAQRLYEEELIKAKEHAEKAERLKMVFLSNMSHELRTPMNGIIGFAEMLRETVNAEKRDDYLKVIINSSKQLMKIITDLMEISKIETGQTEVYNTTIDLIHVFNENLEYCHYLLQQRKKENIEIVLVKPDQNNPHHIISDEVKLRYILACLLNNAVKYTETGSIKFGYEIFEETLRIFVIDTGIGIQEDEKELIFESFRQSESSTRKKFGGNGLGLTIAKGYTQILGGKIWLESKPCEGSAFYVQLPFKKVEKNNLETTEKKPSIWERFHILVVEDDITCFTLIEELLEETGIKITHATTGLEAVKSCRKEENIDLVLMDMRLPEMDGYEATKRIKEVKPNLPIIAQTAHALSEDRKKCISAGCDDYITKPLEQERLLKLMEKYLK